MAANRVGKSYVGAMEMAIHLTGEYPKWWKGKKFKEPIKAWVCGASNETTRDICQKELFGQPDNPRDKGKGSIPKHLIGETTRKPGVPNAFGLVGNEANAIEPEKRPLSSMTPTISKLESLN